MQFTELPSFLTLYPKYNTLEYFELLSHLSTCPPLDANIFKSNIETIMSMGTIIVAHMADKIIASGTIIVEPKIIRGGKCVGHIEDIVVHPLYRGQGISQILLQKLQEYAVSKNCYKIILDCNNSVSNVYLKHGFKVSGIQMSNYL